MAKDTDFANAVINAWNEEVTESKPSVSSETRQITYQDGDSSTSLYGHLVRRQSSVESNSDPPKSVPGVLLFHTGAGPHDVSLLWKADSLVCNEELFPEGCVVLITDILSDDVGWSWSPDRSQFNAARKQVLETLDEKGERPVLKSRIRAALTALQTAAPEIDMDRLASLGWCLGGHSLFEMGRMNIPGMKAMITFHGVFGSVPSPNNTAEDKSQTMHESNKATILICNGDLDPFVNQETDLTNAIDTFRANGHTVRLVNLEGAKHGFSNPAQDFNPNEAFAYNDEAARQSWSETLNLLKETF